MALNFSSFDELLGIVNDDKTLKILFYLREFNPNVSTQDIVKSLGFVSSDITSRMERLIHLGIVEGSTSSLLELTKEGRLLVDTFYNNLGEPVPIEKQKSLANQT